MQDIILRILSKQGFDLSTEEGRRYYEAMTAAYGEDFPLEPEKCFFAKHVAYFRLTHVGDIQLELGGIWVGTPYGEGIAKEWFPWDEILEIGLLSGDGGLGPYAILAADVEEFFRAGRAGPNRHRPRAGKDNQAILRGGPPGAPNLLVIPGRAGIPHPPKQ